MTWHVLTWHVSLHADGRTWVAAVPLDGGMVYVERQMCSYNVVQALMMLRCVVYLSLMCVFMCCNK